MKCTARHKKSWALLYLSLLVCGCPTFCGWARLSTKTTKTMLYGEGQVQPPELVGKGSGDPPVETGRNPQAVALDFIWGIVLIPVGILGLIFFYLFGGFVSTVSKPPPSVPLTEALSALVSIEDDYAARGPRMGLRQRLAQWFQWSEPQRRLDFELGEVKSRSSREVIRKRGMDAAEDIASVVEYFIAGNGIVDDSGSARFADRIASNEASRGYPEAEKFAEKALHEGREALEDAVSMLQEALEEES